MPELRRWKMQHWFGEHKTQAKEYKRKAKQYFALLETITVTKPLQAQLHISLPFLLLLFLREILKFKNQLEQFEFVYNNSTNRTGIAIGIKKEVIVFFSNTNILQAHPVEQ